MSERISLPLREIAEIIQDASGDVKVIFADQDAPQLKPPFITVKETEVTGRLQTDESEPDDLGIASFSSPATAVVQVESYGPNARARLDRILARLRLPSYGDAFSSLNVAFIGRMVSIDSSEVISKSQTEEKAMTELQFSFVQELSDEVGLIETIEVHGSL